ncbi:DUF3313 family protein [Haliea sp. E1-2-M8]|uniref:DUF3313 family protein n=1 Tax=Haliea sp. E1-2-M8 TaxID=3064706 RepID=UPI0027213F36|nr:DUF3313 family protein [Haliea sp. E1-2-M8]MDO8860787.1 DUF3313 family protein [Haliea sp. E1-2-M8]
MYRNLAASLVVITSLVLAACAGSGSSRESALTHDGLERVEGQEFAEVYLRPGADLGHYQHLSLGGCEVAFRKNWLRDQQRDSRNLTSRVRQEDADRIRQRIAAACDEHFRAALERAPAYDLVEAAPNGEDVLVLRPSIVNLDIHAPDVQGAVRTRSYTTSAGEMTLNLELVDALTGQVQGRVVDRRRGVEHSQLQWTSSVTNRAEFRRILRRWADLLRDSVDRVRGA